MGQGDVVFRDPVHVVFAPSLLPEVLVHELFDMPLCLYSLLQPLQANIMLVVKVASTIGGGLGVHNFNTALLMAVSTNPVLDPFGIRAPPF